MGQAHTLPQQTNESLAHRFAQRCARNALSGVELYNFKKNFDCLADETDGILYWPSTTFLRFLTIPDVFEIGEILFASVSYLAAFPYPHAMAPAPLTFENLLKVVVIYTQRTQRVFKNDIDIMKILFQSFAVFDRVLEKHAEDISHELDLKTLESLDEVDVLHFSEKTEEGRVNIETLHKLLVFLLAIRPLKANEPLALLVDRFNAENLQQLRSTATAIVSSLHGVQEGHIDFANFSLFARRSMPYLFEPMNPLFQHFLYSHENLNQAHASQVPKPSFGSNEIMDDNLYAQLALFIPSHRLQGRLRKLYLGSEHGFSLNSFEMKVFKYNAPTLLLVTGSRIARSSMSKQAEAFYEKLPVPRFGPGSGKSNEMVFGVLLNTPWHMSNQNSFGDSDTLLFQLLPSHEVYVANKHHSDYAYFSRSIGIGFGHPPPAKLPAKHSDPFGPSSLFLDSSLEFGMFRSLGPGGSFHTLYPAAEDHEIEERFEIEELAVYGIGGVQEALDQKKAWEWEATEARRRQSVNLGGDIEENRALLEVAGILNPNHRSGGSV